MKQIIYSGFVTNLVGNQIYFKTRSAASYRAETGSAQLVRKNGAAMQFSELVVGDKVEVKGQVWPDNSINAFFVRNLSLYSHNSTFTGKVTGIVPFSSFVIESRKYGKQTILTDVHTVYKNKTGAAVFKDIQLNMNVRVKGVWDRAFTEVLAGSVEITARLLNIEVVGKLVMISPAALTLVGENNVVYGVDITAAKLQSKNSKPITTHEMLTGHSIRAQGKHYAENVQIIASLVKDLSITR